MSKDVINVGGEEKVVREDTAKSYRGVIWALGTLGIVIIIGLIIFLIFGTGALFGDNPAKSPAEIENQRQSR